MDVKFFIAVIHCLRSPWIEISNSGYMKSWGLQNSQFCTFHDFFSKKPNRLSVNLNRFIENIRWNHGKFPSYILAYSLMFFLFPLRWYIPRIKFKRSKELNLHHDMYRVYFPDSITSLRWKKLAIIKYFLDNSNDDFLIIANPSSYLNLDKLVAVVGDERSGFDYCGMVKHSADSAFIVGSFILISRKVATLMVAKRFLIPTHTSDDVAFGAFLTRSGIVPIDIESVELNSASEFSTLSENVLRNTIQFKVKALVENQRIDSQILVQLHDRLRNMQLITE